MDEFYVESMKNAWLNEGISYLTVTIEKNGRVKKKKIEIDEQELTKNNIDFYAECFNIVHNLVKQGYKIVDIETVRYWEY